ncbi:MAG: response regulator [Deltaproteobacteria bacterium]|nr:response regulator [Deltaproteobacteria bacterium]
MAVTQRTALVVDDEPDIVRIVKTMLEGEGYEVWCANDGVEVFGFLDERIPDILIIDRMMPGMNGLEVIRRLKESPKTSSIPVIMLTSMDKFDDVTEGYRGGADGYLTKPFSKKQIINGINLVLSSRQTIQEDELKAHALPFLRACGKLSKRTEELAEWFAAEEGLAPHAWLYQWLETRVETDENQVGSLKKLPEWEYCFSGWGVDFLNSKTGEQAELAIGPGGRSDSFDEWRIQCYIQNEAKRRVDFIDLNALIEKYSDAIRMLMEHLARAGWIEPAQAQGDHGTPELDAQLGDRWVVSAKGAQALGQS